MSSLLQHHGGMSTDGRKVELLAYLVIKGKDWEKYCGPDSYEPNPESTTFTDPTELIPGTNLPKLYRFYRRPAGMWGHWVVFRYNGEEHVPDLSCPLSMFKLPRDAKPLTDKESITYWKS